MDRLVPILYYFPYQFFLNHCWFWCDNVYQNYLFGCLRKKHIETDLKKQRGKLISSLTWHGWTQIIFSNLPHSLSWPAFLWLASFSSKFFRQQDNIFRSSGIYFTSLTISVGRQRCCSNNLTQIQGLPITCSYLGQSQCTGCCCILIGWWVILSPLDPEVGIGPLWMD